MGPVEFWHWIDIVGMGNADKEDDDADGVSSLEARDVAEVEEREPEMAAEIEPSMSGPAAVVARRLTPSRTLLSSPVFLTPFTHLSHSPPTRCSRPRA